MAICVLFQNPGMTKAQYDKAIKGLKAAGLDKPKGRSYHVASPMKGGWQVMDVWDSQKNFEAFGATLMPLLEKLGVKLPAPQILTVHNVIVG